MLDTIGHEVAGRLRPLCYPNTNIAVVCFSIANRASFANVTDKWFKEVSHFAYRTPWVIIGTHPDVRNTKNGLDEKSAGMPNEVVGRDEGRRLTKDLAKKNKMHVELVECDPRDKRGLQPVLDAVSDV